MILTHLALAVLAALSSSSPSPPTRDAPRFVEVLFVEVAIDRSPSRFGGVPVYLQDGRAMTSVRFVVATNEDPSIPAPSTTNERRFGFADETTIEARARELVMNYGLVDGEEDSPALRHVLVRHAGFETDRAVAVGK